MSTTLGGVDVPQEIFQSGPNAAPATFTIAPKQIVQPASVFAQFDGTGAGAAFLACLTIRSKTGDILSRTFPAQTVPAGGTADVTYAPFLRDVGDLPPTVEYATYSAFNQNALPGGGTNTQWVWSGNPGETDLFDLTNPNTPAARKAGVYSLAVTALAQTTAVGNIAVVVDINTADSFFGSNESPLVDTGGPAFASCSVCSPLWPMVAGDTWDGTAWQSSVGAILFNLFAYVSRLA